MYTRSPSQAWSLTSSASAEDEGSRSPDLILTARFPTVDLASRVLRSARVVSKAVAW